MTDKLRAAASWRPGKSNDPYNYGPNEVKKHGIRENHKHVNMIAGWAGKGKQVNDYDSSSHQSAPLSTLKDPSTFAPPPRRTGTSESSNSSPSVTPHTLPQSHSTNTSSTYTNPRAGSVGAPLGRGYIANRRSKREQEQRNAEAAAEAAVALPPREYRVDTTGLSRSSFAAPPKFRPVQSSSPSKSQSPTPPTGAKPPRPALPPRLPPRGNATSPPPPSYEQVEAETAPERGILNAGALGRLGQAGISVPGFGIGAGSGGARPSPPLPARGLSSSPPAPALVSHGRAGIGAGAAGVGFGGQMSELQARIARIGIQSNNDTGTKLPTSAGRKKPPLPPPPKKKRQFDGAAGGELEVPLASRPR